MLYQFGALRKHSAILLAAVTVRDYDHRLQPRQPCRHRHSLPMIAARSCHHACQAGLALLEPIDIDQRSAHFEGANWGVVFMFDPDLGAQALAEQRPTELRRGRHRAIDHTLGFVNLGQGRKLHGYRIAKFYNAFSFSSNEW